jgi:hypothetical protein
MESAPNVPLCDAVWRRFPVTPECLKNEQAGVTLPHPYQPGGERRKGEIAQRNADETSYRQGHRN